MEESRLNILFRKSLLVMGSDFPIPAGSLGQMEADISVNGIKIISQETGDDTKLFQVLVEEVIKVSGSRSRYISREDNKEGYQSKTKYPQNVFMIPDDRFPNMDERDMNKKLRVIINFKVVEQMPRYTMLKISSLFLMPKQDISMRIGGA